jgi:hypothetical protein
MSAYEKKSLTEYWNMLARHDWYHEYSDDQSVWRRGNTAEGILRFHAAQSPEHNALYNAFREHYFPPHNTTERTPIPPRPE